jgi:hypothetical protein
MVKPGGYGLGQHRGHPQGRWQMFSVGNTSTEGLSRGQDQPAGVRVAPCGNGAVRAPQGAFRPVEACLSRRAPRTRQGRVGGGHQQRRSPHPRATFDQFACGRAHRGVSTHAGRRGLRQEPGAEALSGDHLIVVEHPVGPSPAGVLVLLRALLVQPRRFPGGWPIPVRRLHACGLSGCSTAPAMTGRRQRGHHRAAPFPAPTAQTGGFSGAFR